MPAARALPLIALALAFALPACASGAATPPANVTRIVSTTSFGMCVGYCTTRLEITEGEAVLIREARGGRGAPDPSAQPQRFSTPLTPAEWQEIQRLAAATDLTTVPDVVGCPDCAPEPTAMEKRSTLLGWLLILCGTIAGAIGLYFVSVAFGIYRMFGWDGATFWWIVFAAIGVVGIAMVVIGAGLLRAKQRTE
jgi:hypothetical protein